ncbi:hypothetical protein BHE74_00009688 [Ensete ventricosum]|nr:hypothetical protein BHE74_00009688 [Ensete ventricosum]
MCDSMNQKNRCYQRRSNRRLNSTRRWFDGRRIHIARLLISLVDLEDRQPSGVGMGDGQGLLLDEASHGVEDGGGGEDPGQKPDHGVPRPLRRRPDIEGNGVDLGTVACLGGVLPLRRLPPFVACDVFDREEGYLYRLETNVGY